MSSELRVNNFKTRSGLGTVSVNESGLDVTGIVTAASFSGDISGNATGLSGTPNLNVGVITATQYVGVPEGTNVLKAMLFV
mgnify:CR=1 FL=1